MNRGKVFSKIAIVLIAFGALMFIGTKNNVFAATSATKVAEITKKSIANLEIQTNNTVRFVYKGTPRKLTVTIKDGLTQLQYGKDYTIQYINNVEPGKATAIIKGKGNYTGSVKVKFHIYKSINNCKLITNSNKYCTYTGNPRKIAVTIYDGKTLLEYRKDYKISYIKNIKPGKATAIITGRGMYTGTVRVNFYIAPKKATIKSVTFNSSFKKATVKWARDGRASGYKIYMAESIDGPYTKIKTITDIYQTTYTKAGLDPNKIYYFKVRSYKSVDNDTKHIATYYSNPKSNTGLVATITLTSPTSGYDRNYNLKKASDTINGTILKPGEVFNWFKVVGQASAAKGYRKAIIFQGSQHVSGYGGGVCQVSSTIYQASRNAGLEILERHGHGQPVSYTTEGNDATVYYGVLNLRIKNNKNYTLKFVTSAEGGSTTCKIYRIV